MKSMNRYDLIIFCDERDPHPEDMAQMYPHSEGKYVRAEDALEQIQKLKQALVNLKNCNINYNNPEDLNMYVNKILEEVA